MRECWCIHYCMWFACVLIGLKKKLKTFEKNRGIVTICEIPSQIVLKTPIHPPSRCYPYVRFIFYVLHFPIFTKWSKLNLKWESRSLGLIMQMITSIKSYLLIFKKKILSMNPLALVLLNKIGLLKEKIVIFLLLQELFGFNKMFLNCIRGKQYLPLFIL